MSDPGSIRYSVGGGLLTVANDLLVFVAPGGAVAEEWSDLALAPATQAELASAVGGDIPADHYVAVVQLQDGGLAFLQEPNGDPVSGHVVRSGDGQTRFGMAPASTSSLWIGAGVVGASGFEIAGFGLSARGEPEISPAVASDARQGTHAPEGALPTANAAGRDPLPGRDTTIVDRPATSLLFEPPAEDQAEATPPPPIGDPIDGLDLPPPPVLDPPILSTSLFPNLPIGAPDADLPVNPIIERAPTPPPPGLPVVGSTEPGSAPPVSLVFDDGQNIALTATMAIGRAPEGSEHAPPGCVVVVVAGDQVSRCHFLIRPTAIGAEVVDTNSLNGCFVDYPDRPGTGPQIPVGVPVPIEPGQQLRFGDRSLTIVAG